MKPVIPSSHPYWHVRSIVERRADVVAVPASYYTYKPQTVADTRTDFLIPVAEFLDPQQMQLRMEQTPVGQEMAVNSDFRLTSEVRVHLVMVDMSTSAKAHLEKLRAFLGDNVFHKIAWFESGRSFHGYGDSLLDEREWVKFMGLLLLANQPRLEPTVDPRWIGHRLLAGYSSLRWTKNTTHYRGVPTILDKPAHNRPAASRVGLIGKSLISKK